MTSIEGTTVRLLFNEIGGATTDGLKVDAWICNPEKQRQRGRYDRWLPDKILEMQFTVGSAINVCYAADDETYAANYGVFNLPKLQNFDWLKYDGGWNTQPTVRDGDVTTDNPLSAFDPDSCSELGWCSFTSILKSNFFLQSGALYGLGEAIYPTEENGGTSVEFQFALFVNSYIEAIKDQKLTKTNFALDEDKLEEVFQTKSFENSEVHEYDYVDTASEKAEERSTVCDQQDQKFQQCRDKDREGMCVGDAPHEGMTSWLPSFLKQLAQDPSTPDFCDEVQEYYVCPHLLDNEDCCKEEMLEWLDCIVTEEIPWFPCPLDCFQDEPDEPLNWVVALAINSIAAAMLFLYLYFEFFKEIPITSKNNEKEPVKAKKQKKDLDQSFTRKYCQSLSSNDSCMIAAQFLSLLAVLSSWTWWVTLPMSVVVMLMHQFVWCCRCHKRGITMISMISIVASFSCIAVGIYEMFMLKDNGKCSLFSLENNDLLWERNDDCPEQIYAAVSFVTGALWLASAGCGVYFVRSGRFETWAQEYQPKSLGDMQSEYGIATEKVESSEGDESNAPKGAILEDVPEGTEVVSMATMKDDDDDNNDEIEVPKAEELEDAPAVTSLEDPKSVVRTTEVNEGDQIEIEKDEESETKPEMMAAENPATTSTRLVLSHNPEGLVNRMVLHNPVGESPDAEVAKGDGDKEVGEMSKELCDEWRGRS